MSRPKNEIENEIKALESLKPIGAFAKITAQRIKMAIEELKDSFDQTSGEWDELDYSEQEVINDARRWKEMETENKPSESWEGLAV